MKNTPTAITFHKFDQSFRSSSYDTAYVLQAYVQLVIVGLVTRKLRSGESIKLKQKLLETNKPNPDLDNY